MSILCISGIQLTLYRKLTACQACAKARMACHLSVKESRRRVDKE